MADVDPIMLYKYCSFETATRIISSNVLRLYRSSVMNDTAEITFGFDIYLDELSLALDNVTSNTERWRIGSLIIDAFDVFNQYGDTRFSKELLRKCGFPKDNAELEHFKRVNLGPDEDKYSAVYMTCFSGTPDDLTQWRSYANDATGICIGFHRAELEGLSRHKPTYGETPIQLSRVHYGQESAREFFREQINIAAAGGSEIWPIAKECYIRMATTKHECFRSENEWRLFIFVKALRTRTLVDVDGRRPRQYLELKHFKGGEMLPIGELWSGPTSAFKSDSDEGWKMFVAQHLEGDSLDKITFRSSSLPYIHS